MPIRTVRLVVGVLMLVTAVYFWALIPGVVFVVMVIGGALLVLGDKLKL